MRLYGICGVSVALLCGACSWFFSAEAFKITSVQVFGADTDITPQLTQEVSNSIQGRYLGLFSRSSAFIYPKQQIIQQVKMRSPRVSSVVVRRDGWHTLLVTVTQKTPVAVVCASLPDWNQETLSDDQLSQCYFADETGYLFEQALSFSGHVYNRYFTPDVSVGTSSDALVGTYATSTAEFALLQTVYERMRSLHIEPEGILFKAHGEYELYADEQYTDAKGAPRTDIFVVYFDSARPYAIQFDNFSSFWLAKMTAAHMSPHFEYIDVRYGSNVFFKTTAQ